MCGEREREREREVTIYIYAVRGQTHMLGVNTCVDKDIRDIDIRQCYLETVISGSVTSSTTNSSRAVGPLPCKQSMDSAISTALPIWQHSKYEHIAQKRILSTYDMEMIEK